MFADFPQMRLRRSPPNCGGLPQMKKEQPTPHLQLPFRSPIAAAALCRTVVNCADSMTHLSYNNHEDNPSKPTIFPHLWKPAAIRRAAPQAHLRIICGHLRPEPYRRAKHPHRELQHPRRTPAAATTKNPQSKKNQFKNVSKKIMEDQALHYFISS